MLAFDFPIQLVLGLEFADICARSNLSNIREHFYCSKQHNHLGKESFMPAAVPKTDLGLENELKNQVNFSEHSVTRLNLHLWASGRNQAVEIWLAWCHICLSSVLAWCGHVYGGWRHTPQVSYLLRYPCAHRGATAATTPSVSDQMQKRCSWGNLCLAVCWGSQLVVFVMVFFLKAARIASVMWMLGNFCTCMGHSATSSAGPHHCLGEGFSGAGTQALIPAQA